MEFKKRQRAAAGGGDDFFAQAAAGTNGNQPFTQLPRGQPAAVVFAALPVVSAGHTHQYQDQYTAMQ
jgi:hypothetical protein